MGTRVSIGTAQFWRSKDGTVYESDSTGYVDCDLKHAKELLSGMSDAKKKAPKKVDYTSWNKDKLIKECETRGLEVEGNKDDLIARLVTSDG